MNKQLAFLIGLTTFLMIHGCAVLLPRSTSVTKSPWKSYTEVVSAYDKVVTKKSTTNDLKKLGFDVYSTVNLKILSYVDIAVATQTLKKDEVSNGIVACLRAQNMCNGYVFEPQVIHSERYGNFWLDVFRFKRKTKMSGWKYKATFLVVDSVVVDKFWSGEPLVDQDQEDINPLGPLQELGNMLSTPKIGF